MIETAITPMKRSQLQCSCLTLMPFLRLASSPQSEQQIRATVKHKIRQKDYLGAITLLNQLLQQHPKSAIDYNNRGLIYFWQGKFNQAIQDYNRAIELNAKLDRVYNNRANCHAAQGNLLAAVMDYETALDLNPANVRTRINQGITFRQLGEYELALENFDVTLVLTQDYQGMIYAERGRTYHLWGDWNFAIADYRRALSLLPQEDDYRQKVELWLDRLLNNS